MYDQYRTLLQNAVCQVSPLSGLRNTQKKKIDKKTWKGEVCPILRHIYAWHCIILYPRNNRLTIQYNRERSNAIECNTIPCINLLEYLKILQKKMN